MAARRVDAVMGRSSTSIVIASLLLVVHRVTLRDRRLV